MALKIIKPNNGTSQSVKKFNSRILFMSIFEEISA